MKCLWILALGTACVVGAWGQGLGAAAVQKFPAYKLIDGRLDAGGLPTSGAKICVHANVGDCYQIPSNDGYSKGGVVYDYGLNPKAQRLPLRDGGSLVLFSAMCSGGGSGTLESLAILKYNGVGQIVDLLPFVGVTNQGEHAVWSIAEISDYPILVTADADWTEGETHFARHFYDLSAYRLDTRTERYARILKYRTSKKYASLDEVDEVRVVEPERAEIMRRLKLVPKLRP